MFPHLVLSSECRSVLLLGGLSLPSVRASSDWLIHNCALYYRWVTLNVETSFYHTLPPFEKLMLTFNICHKIHPLGLGLNPILKSIWRKKCPLKSFLKNTMSYFMKSTPLDLYMLEQCKYTIIEQFNIYIYITTTSHDNIHSGDVLVV